MKKAFISFVSIIVFLGMVGMASAYSVDSSYVLPGNWTELYTGGGPGQPNNSLSAQSLDLPPGFSSPPYITWTLSGMILDQILDIQPIDDYVEYTTRYTGGALIMSGFPTFTNLTAIVVADIWSYDYDGIITMSGGGLYMEGHLSEVGTVPNGHWGMIYVDELSIEDNGPIIPTPEPAILLLLGCGLAGLAGIRRKLKG
jgi:hypothetical protein